MDSNFGKEKFGKICTNYFSLESLDCFANGLVEDNDYLWKLNIYY